MSDDRGREMDLAIDRAVCEMLDVEPRADLRAKVIARIEDSSRSSVFGLRFPAFTAVRLGMLIAAAALLVLAVTLARRSEPVVQAPADAHAGAVHLTSPGAPARQAAPPPAPVTAGLQQTRRALASPVPAASVADATPRTATAIEPMGPITPIEVAPIRQSSIAPEPIDVRPLNPITEVQIAPLTPPDRRD